MDDFESPPPQQQNTDTDMMTDQVFNVDRYSDDTLLTYEEFQNKSTSHSSSNGSRPAAKNNNTGGLNNVATMAEDILLLSAEQPWPVITLEILNFYIRVKNLGRTTKSCRHMSECRTKRCIYVHQINELIDLFKMEELRHFFMLNRDTIKPYKEEEASLIPKTFEPYPIQNWKCSKNRCRSQLIRGKVTVLYYHRETRIIHYPIYVARCQNCGLENIKTFYL